MATRKRATLYVPLDSLSDQVGVLCQRRDVTFVDGELGFLSGLVGFPSKTGKHVRNMTGHDS